MRSIVGVFLAFSEGGSGSNPTRISAHHFNDRNKIVLPHGFVIESGFFNHGAQVFNHTSITGTVISGYEVVINGLWHTNDAKLISLALSKF